MSLTGIFFFELTAVYILLAWGTYVNWRNGQLYMGPVFTMGIGAYVSGYASVEWGWPFGLALIAAIGAGALASFLPALGLGRSPAFTVAVATLGLIAIAQAVYRNLEVIGGIGGYYGIPRVDYLVPVTIVILIIVGFLIYRLDNSRIGRAMEMTSADPDVASSLGINRYRLGIFVQILGGILGAIAGVLYAFTAGAIDPGDFSFFALLRTHTFFFVGGANTMWGALILTPPLFALNVLLTGEVAEWSILIYAILLAATLILRPEGVVTKQVTRTFAAKVRVLMGQLKFMFGRT